MSTVGEGISLPSRDPGQSGPSSVVKPCAGAAEDKIMFPTKTIDFCGHRKTIVYQRTWGPCSLIAICNFLSLTNRITINPDNDGEVSKDDLFKLILECLMACNSEERDKYVYSLEKFAEGVFPNLTAGLDMDVMFQKVDSFTMNQGRLLFHLLDIPIYHAWLVDPQNEELFKVVGTESYDTLTMNFSKFDTGVQLDASSDPAADPTITGLQSDENTTGIDSVHKWKLFNDFRKENLGETTVYGLFKLHEKIKEQELCVWYHNQHFSTLYKHKGSLYALLTADAYRDLGNCVWEKLMDVNDRGYVVDGLFKSTSENPQLPSTVFDEQLARRLHQENFSDKNLRDVDDQTEPKNAGSDMNYERKAIPNRKLIAIEKLLKAHGGEKVALELQGSSRYITELRKALADKKYDETSFGDWFEPHDPAGVSNRLTPLSKQGKFSAYAATKIPEITTMITENSSSSGSLEQRDGFLPIYDNDPYDDVEDATSKAKHLKGSKKVPKPRVPGNKLTRSVETERTQARSEAPVAYKVKEGSTKSLHSKVQKVRAVKPLIPPEGSATRKEGYNLRPRKQVTYAQSFSSTGKRRRQKKASKAYLDLDNANAGRDDIEFNNLSNDPDPEGGPAEDNIDFINDNAEDLDKTDSNAEDAEYVGFEHHRISAANLRKEHIRFKSMASVLDDELYCCILLNPTRFDTFSGLSRFEYGVGIRDSSVTIDVSLKHYGLKVSEKINTREFEVGPYKLCANIYKNEAAEVKIISLGDVQLIHAIFLGSAPPPTRSLLMDLEAFSADLVKNVLDVLSGVVKGS